MPGPRAGRGIVCRRKAPFSAAFPCSSFVWWRGDKREKWDQLLPALAPRAVTANNIDIVPQCVCACVLREGACVRGCVCVCEGVRVCGGVNVSRDVCLLLGAGGIIKPLSARYPSDNAMLWSVAPLVAISASLKP